MTEHASLDHHRSIRDHADHPVDAATEARPGAKRVIPQGESDTMNCTVRSMGGKLAQNLQAFAFNRIGVHLKIRLSEY